MMVMLFIFIDYLSDFTDDLIADYGFYFGYGYEEDMMMDDDQEIIKNKFQLLDILDVKVRDENDENACEICYINIKKVKLLPCDHKFCVSCFNHIGRCAMCRADINNCELL